MIFVTKPYQTDAESVVKMLLTENRKFYLMKHAVETQTLKKFVVCSKYIVQKNVSGVKQFGLGFSHEKM